MQQLILGDIELSLLLDAHTSVEGNKAFYPAQPAQWGQFFGMTENGQVPNVVRSLLIREGNALTLVDTGFGEVEPGHARGTTLDSLAEMGIKPGDISRVILTHAHGDHCLGNTVQRAGRWIPVFPMATHVVQKAEVAAMADAKTELWTTRFAPLADRDQLELVDGCQRLTDSLELWPTPGHTIGHQAVVIRSNDRLAAFVGDLAVFAANFVHPNWGPDWAWSRTEAARTRSRIADWAIEHDAVLIVPHDPDRPCIRIENTDDGLALRAAL